MIIDKFEKSLLFVCSVIALCGIFSDCMFFCELHAEFVNECGFNLMHGLGIGLIVSTLICGTLGIIFLIEGDNYDA